MAYKATQNDWLSPNYQNTCNFEVLSIQLYHNIYHLCQYPMKTLIVLIAALMLSPLFTFANKCEAQLNMYKVSLVEIDNQMQHSDIVSLRMQQLKKDRLTKLMLNTKHCK